MAFSVALLLCALVYALTQPSYLPLPQNKPAMVLNQLEKVEVMKTLFQQNREEIRFYQDKLFTLSFTFSAALLGIVAFALKNPGQSSPLRRVLVVSCFMLCIFYLLFVRFADTAILVNDKDLIGIQYALDLSQTNAYLTNDPVVFTNGQIICQPFTNGQVIYQPHEPTLMKHTHIRWIAIFNVLLTLASAFVLVRAPKVKGDDE